MRANKRKWLAILVFLILASFGCGGPASTPQGPPPSSGAIPELTDELIKEEINYSRVRDVPEESGIAHPISWSFHFDEPKEIKIVERQMHSNRATLILDIKTESAPGSRIHRKLAGQIRTEWELRTGWVLRKWEIDKTENISMKYKDHTPPPGPPPPPGNSNSNGN